MPQYRLDIRDYWRIIKKRKVLIILTILLVGFFSLIFAQINAPKPIYKATSEIKYERSTLTMGLFPERIFQVPWDIIATQALVIKSFPVMERVAKELGLIDRAITTGQIIKSKDLLNLISSVQKSVSTKQKGKTNIIAISGQSHHPRMAQKIANTVAQSYRENNIEDVNRQSLESAKFIEEQIKIMGEKLKVAEERLKNFQKNNNLVSLDFKTKTSLILQADAESKYEKVKNELKEIENQFNLVKQGKTLPPSLTSQLNVLTLMPRPGFPETPSDMHSPVLSFRSSGLDRLNDMLVDLNLQKRTLLLDFTESHPKVKEVEGRIQAVRTEIENILVSEHDDLQRQETVLKIQLQRLKAKNSLLPESALELARLEREVKINEELFSLLRSKYQEALIKVSERVEEVTITRLATEPVEPINPPPITTTTILGTIIGLMLGLVFSFFLETVDSSLRTIEGVETYLGVPVLGVIPEVDRKEFKEKYAPVKNLPDNHPLLEMYINLSAHFAPKSPVAEAYRLLRTNLKFLGMEKMGKSFIITSSTLREGKTTNVINLALTMAQAGMKTLIVESDLRKPSIYSVFGLYKEPGLTDILLGNYTWEEVVKGITDLMVGKLEMGDLMKTPGIDNLYIITCGSIPPNPSELLSSPKMSKFITEIKQNFDFVLFDTPPILPVADAAILSQAIDGTLLIYEVGKVARRVLKRAKTHIDNVKGSVWGVILNNMKTGISPDYYRYPMNFYHETGGKKSYILLSKLRDIVQRHLSKFFIPLLPHRLRLLILLSVLLILTVILWQMNYLQGSKNKIPLAQKWLRGVFKEEKRDLPYPKTIIPKSEIEESKGEETINLPKEEPLHTTQDFLPITYYPYSILISSNQEEKYALTDWRVLHSQGYSAYINLTNVKGKGEFYRVFVGIFEREDEARECAKKIKGPFTSSVLSTPYSLEIGVFSSRDTADQEMENLQKKGYFPYLVPIQEGQEFRVLLGAFTRSEEFVSLSQQLMAEGITYQVVRR